MSLDPGFPLKKTGALQIPRYSKRWQAFIVNISSDFDSANRPDLPFYTIDAESPYHNLRSFNKLKESSERCRHHRISAISLQREQWMAFVGIFFNEPINSLQLKRALVQPFDLYGISYKARHTRSFSQRFPRILRHGTASSTSNRIRLSE